MLKEWANKALGKIGYRVTAKGRRLHLHDACTHLFKNGVRPGTVIDIGVAWGTPELYEAFPQSKLLLVEPNADWRGTLERLLKNREGSFEICAAGQQEGTLEFNIWEDAPGSSSQFAGQLADNAKRRVVVVPMKRLDDLCTLHACTGPYLIKIDVQGAELQVLKGADAILPETTAVIIESSLFGHGEVPEVHDVMAFMHDRGFAIYDVVGANYRPLDQALAQVDLVFVKAAGTLRTNHRWA